MSAIKLTETQDAQVPPQRGPMAELIHRAPWLATVASYAVWMTRPRYSVGVMGAVLNAEGQLLLAEHVFHPYMPWALPGGWVGRNEAPNDGLQRELHEELGLEVDILHILDIRQGIRHMHLDIAYLCHARSEVAHICSELVSYRWCSMDDLPPLTPFHRELAERALTYPTGGRA
jgi:ADP-ribose pyrophosphatase YjhB (NUDIX family)